MSHPLFPFSAIVGQERMKRALIFNAIDSSVGGVLISGTRGTAKSTAARSLAALLPEIEIVTGDPFHHQPNDGEDSSRIPTPFVNLPLGATEDRLLGTLDIERALKTGERRFEPGLLAQAHRGVLYVDEVNLLPDHLVDVLLDAVAMGVNRIEREGISFEHEARVILIGTMNPEEGELRPQLLDRFGLSVGVESYLDAEQRKEVVRRRLAFDDDPEDFIRTWAESEQKLSEKIGAACRRLRSVNVPDECLDQIAELTAGAHVDGLRADIVIYKTARVIAAFENEATVQPEHVEEAAALALAHRRRSREEPRPAPPSKPGPAPETKPPGTARPPYADGSSRQPESPSASDDSQQRSSAAQSPAETHFRVGDPLDLRLDYASRKLQSRTGSLYGRRSGPLACNRRGAFVRAVERRPGDPLDIAVAASLRAAALERSSHTDGLPLQPRHLRLKQRRQRCRTLVLFVVDASGSMAAAERMRAAKGAVCGLLEEAYQKRDWIGLVAFRGEQAEELLPPTRSSVFAYRKLEQLPTGGRTPLAAGLRKALEIFVRQERKQASLQPYLVLITDGRATMPPSAPLAAALTQARYLLAKKIPALCIDTENGPARFGQTRQLADAMGAEYRHIAALPPRQWSHVVREWVAASGGHAR